MPRYRRCAVIACKNRRIPLYEKVFTFPYVKEVAEEWVRFSNNPDLCVEEAHLYAKRGRVMCHRHFTTAQFTTTKRLRLNRGAIPTIQNSADEVCDNPPVQGTPPYNYNEKNDFTLMSDSRGIDSCGSDGHEDTELENNEHNLCTEKPKKEEGEEDSSRSENKGVILKLNSPDARGPSPKQQNKIDSELENDNESPT